jgi:colanic acid biosynthesis glycosyl transferase WcaI
MRIGMLTQWYEPEPGPAALPSGLARELVARGHEVQVVTGFPNYPTGKVTGGYRQRRRFDEVLGGVNVRRVALYPNHDTSALRRVINYGSFAASVCASGLDVLSDVDALWVNYSPVTIGLPMLALQRRHRTPAVVHVLDLWPDTVTASGLGGGRASALETPLHRWCDLLYRRAHSVAYISPGVGEVLSQRGVPRDKLAYAPMWADESVNCVRPAADERGWGLGATTIALVYAGSLGGAQDLSTLVQACARVRDLDFRCLVAGSGTHEEELVQLATAAGADNVTFLGRLSPAEVAELTAAADVHYVGLNDHPLAGLTMPSKVQAILACGRPIIGSVVGDAADVVRRSGGWTSQPGDVPALVENLRAVAAAGRGELRERQRSARDLYVAEFARASGVDRIEELLVSAAESGRRG